MFTGIVETMGTVTAVEEKGTNLVFKIDSNISAALRVDQSVAHDGVCLTVEATAGTQHQVTAIAETLEKTCLGTWKPGKKVNLERSLLLTSRLDGHFVQGHADTTAQLEKIRERKGSYELEFSFGRKWASLLIEKGSICINGTSLTVFDVKKQSFRVAIIPYTWQHTNLSMLQPGHPVNIEFDILGKYIQRMLHLKKAHDH